MSALAVKALAAIGRGEVVIVTDDMDRENEGDFIMAADAATTESLAFFLEHTSGVICAALPGSQLDELDLPLMVSDNQEAQRTAFTVTVDLARGVTTGIRPPTARARSGRSPILAPSPGTSFAPATSCRCAAARAGCSSPGHTEASVYLARSRALARRGALRGRHPGQRCHGAASGARGARPRAWAANGHHRRAQAAPAAHRAAHPPGRRGAVADASWHVHLPGVAVRDRRRRPPGPRHGRPRVRRPGARPRSQRVPDW